MADPRYLELLNKIDTKAAELEAMHRPHLRCSLACHGCCKPGLTVFPVEAEHIREYLTERPELLARTLENEKRDPHKGQRCSFLDAKGACLIYPVRPVVCRTHGLPLEIREEERVYRDVCPLNFQEMPLEDLPRGGVLNLQLINTLLTLITQNSHGERFPLREALSPRALVFDLPRNEEMERGKVEEERTSAGPSAP